MELHSNFDAFISNATRKAELIRLRTLALDCGLTEKMKWGQPCFMYRGHNVAIIGELKDCCVLSFFKGELLQDRESILVRPGEHTQGVRLVRITSVSQLTKLESTLREYLFEAIELEKADVKLRKAPAVPPPKELEAAFRKNPAFREAFASLTPGRRRGYLLYFNAAKQTKTREARIEKWKLAILEGKGMLDDMQQSRKQRDNLDE